MGPVSGLAGTGGRELDILRAKLLLLGAAPGSGEIRREQPRSLEEERKEAKAELAVKTVLFSEGGVRQRVRERAGAAQRGAALTPASAGECR